CDLKQNTPRLHHGNPVVRRALSAAHPRLRRLGSDGLGRKDTDPDLATTPRVASDNTTCRFNLLALQPTGALRLQTKLAKRHFGPTVRGALTTAAMHLTMLDSLWHQHGTYLLRRCAGLSGTTRSLAWRAGPAPLCLALARRHGVR